jgi:hypothetical protein
MTGFLFPHAVEDLSGGRKILSQDFGVVAIYALVFFL